MEVLLFHSPSMALALSKNFKTKQVLHFTFLPPSLFLWELFNRTYVSTKLVYLSHISTLSNKRRPFHELQVVSQCMEKNVALRDLYLTNTREMFLQHHMQKSQGEVLLRIFGGGLCG